MRWAVNRAGQFNLQTVKRAGIVLMKMEVKRAGILLMKMEVKRAGILMMRLTDKMEVKNKTIELDPSTYSYILLTTSSFANIHP